MSNRTNEEPLISLHGKSEFETNLFLKRQVKELQETVKGLKSGSELRAKDVEIGALKGEIVNLEDKIKRMRDREQRNGKKKLKQIISDQKVIIENLRKTQAQ